MSSTAVLPAAQDGGGSNNKAGKTPSKASPSVGPASSTALQGPGELKDVFADLEFRFLSNLPESEFKSERLFFHLEQAWWLYEDELSDKHQHLPHFKFEDFAREFFKRSSILKPVRSQFDAMYMTFKDYQHRIPVYGVALLTSDLQKVLLVTGFRSQNSWGFPKGKINQGEDELACAIREVYEETGFDAAYLQPRKEDKMVWSQKNGKSITIFIVPGVPEDFPFAPRVVKEIDEIKWWRISDLPRPDKSNAATETVKASKNKFWGVSAFTGQLRRWIARKQNITLPPGEDFSAGEDTVDTEEEDLGGLKSGGVGEFPVEEMFRVNKILREKELAQGKASATPGKATGKQEKTKKDRAAGSAKTEKAKQLQVTAIAKNANRKATTSQNGRLQTSSANGGGFTIDFGRVSKAMEPFLA